MKKRPPEPIKKIIPRIFALLLTVAFVVLTVNRLDFTDRSFLTSLENQWIAAKFQLLPDITATPSDDIPTSELQGNVINNVASRQHLNRGAAIRFLDIAAVLLFGVLIAIRLPDMSAARSIIYATMALGAFTVINVMSFLYLHWVMGYVYPGMALVFISGSLISWKYLTEEPDRKRTQQTFQTYLDPVDIEQVATQPEKIALSGERKEMSVLFSDIRGFTTFSEKMAPGDVVNFLNQYFDRMTAVIFQHKGTLDKLIGDAVMCFWGHPLETADHAFRSTLCALQMLQTVEELRPVLLLPGRARLEIGIGINTGAMIVGNLGSQTRFSYTVVGDNVNLGSKLESFNKHYGTRILISQSTFEACRNLIRCREVDTIQIKGKSVTIYEPLGLRRFDNDRRIGDRRSRTTPLKRISNKLSGSHQNERREGERRLGSERLVIRPDQEEIATIYEHALGLYRKGDLDEAEKAFEHVLTLSPADGPSRLMKRRITRYRQQHAQAESQFNPVFKFDKK
jgi:class 3 adenylate cyclase